MKVTVTSRLQMESDCSYKMSANEKANFTPMLVLENENCRIERWDSWEEGLGELNWVKDHLHDVWLSTKWKCKDPCSIIINKVKAVTTEHKPSMGSFWALVPGQLHRSDIMSPHWEPNFSTISVINQLVTLAHLWSMFVCFFHLSFLSSKSHTFPCSLLPFLVYNSDFRILYSNIKWLQW